MRRSSGVRLLLEDSKRKSVPPETRARPRTVQGQTTVETGPGNPVDFQNASERAKAFKARYAHLRADRRDEYRRINQVGRVTARTRRSELEQDCVASRIPHDGPADQTFPLH